MPPITNCSQLDPYAGKTSPCGGNVHNLTTKYIDDRMKPIDIQVCDSHMESFRALGLRIGYLFTIIGDKIIGVITPASLEGQRPSGNTIK